MKATRQDVATRAGVSVATVTYVINRTRPISEETARRVREAIAELHYRPDQIAKSMATHRSMQLGIFVDNISSPFYGDIVQGFEAAASEKGYFVNVCTSHRRYSDYFENAIARRLDGLFVMVPNARYDAGMLDKMYENGIPVVTSGYPHVDGRRFCSIENNYAGGVETVMRTLYARGHREIAFLSGLSRSLEVDSRAPAYLDMIERLGLKTGDTLLVDVQPEFSTDAQDGYALAKRLLKTRRPFTAALCINDLTAIGAYAAFREANLRIPEDVAVVGIDDIFLCKYLTPSLSSLSFDKIAFGRRAFDMLSRNITDGVVGYYLNSLTLIQRGSTDVNRVIMP